MINTIVGIVSLRSSNKPRASSDYKKRAHSKDKESHSCGEENVFTKKPGDSCGEENAFTMNPDNYFDDGGESL